MSSKQTFNQEQVYCSFYLKNKCKNKQDCDFSHSIPVCKYFLQGECKNRHCNYLHFIEEDKNAKELDIDQLDMKALCKKTTLCVDFEKGTCSKPSFLCNFAHGKEDQFKGVCKFKSTSCEFFKNNCCKWLHVDIKKDFDILKARQQQLKELSLSVSPSPSPLPPAAHSNAPSPCPPSPLISNYSILNSNTLQRSPSPVPTFTTSTNRITILKKLQSFEQIKEEEKEKEEKEFNTITNLETNLKNVTLFNYINEINEQDQELKMIDAKVDHYDSNQIKEITDTNEIDEKELGLFHDDYFNKECNKSTNNSRSQSPNCVFTQTPSETPTLIQLESLKIDQNQVNNLQNEVNKNKQIINKLLENQLNLFKENSFLQKKQVELDLLNKTLQTNLLNLQQQFIEMNKIIVTLFTPSSRINIISTNTNDNENENELHNETENKN